MLVAVLERAELVQRPEMPFADERGLVARGFELRGERWLARLEAHLFRRGGQRLLLPDRQPVLVSPGGERHARGRADAAIRVALLELHSVAGQGVDGGRADIVPPEAADI